MMPESDNTHSTGLVAIDFHGDQIVTFQHKGEPHVAMRRVVENLGLDWATQQRKLAQGNRFNCGPIPTVGADGKTREMLAMPAVKLALWLATINPNKIPDDAKRAKIELYQAESAIVLHDYWTKGVAVRGDQDGLVTSLDPGVMRALLGGVKGVINKALTETLPGMVAAEIASRQYTVARGLTAGEVISEAGIKNTKGLRGIARRVSDKLRRFHAEKGVPVKLGSLGASTAYVFDLPLVREWLMSGGKAYIEQWVSERRGQGRLKLVNN